MSWLRAEVKTLLARGSASACGKTAGVCREILAVEESLWTFAGRAGVEPTNNAAERAVRHAVCLRKTSYGTASERGSRFVERILTVVASCRQQRRGVLDFLVKAVTGQNPSLLPQGSSRFEGLLLTYRNRLVSPASNPIGSIVAQRPSPG